MLEGGSYCLQPRVIITYDPVGVSGLSQRVGGITLSTEGLPLGETPETNDGCSA